MITKTLVVLAQYAHQILVCDFKVITKPTASLITISKLLNLIEHQNSLDNVLV